MTNRAIAEHLVVGQVFRIVDRDDVKLVATGVENVHGMMWINAREFANKYNTIRIIAVDAEVDVFEDEEKPEPKPEPVAVGPRRAAFTVTHEDGYELDAEPAALESVIFEVLTEHDPAACRVLHNVTGVAYRVTFD